MSGITEPPQYSLYIAKYLTVDTYLRTYGRTAIPFDPLRMSAASIESPTPAPSPAPRSSAAIAVDSSEERARLAARTLADALLLGIVGDAILRVPEWGANMAVWSIAIVAAMITLARRRYEAVPGDARWLLVPALALSVLFTWRNSEYLVVYNTLAFFGTLALLATAISQGTEHRVLESRFRELANSAVIVGITTFVGMIALLLSDVSFRQVAGARGAGRAIAALRAALVAIPLLLVFGSLFASADPVFARLASDVFRIDAATVASHLAVTGIIAWFVGGLLRATVLSSGRSNYSIPFPDGALGLTEVATALGSLVALFAAFVVVQLRYFFGGDALVQATAGMSYADYARRGFFELVTVSALVLPVLLSANALLRRATLRADVVFRALSGTLLCLLGIIMYSAVARMQLYMSAYGLSMDRLLATVFMGWLATVFLWFAATVLRGRERVFMAGVLVSGWATLIALNIADPAGYVARFDIARAERGKEVDVAYIASLGADAAPALARHLARDHVAPPANWIVPGQDSVSAAGVAPNALGLWSVGGGRESADFGERCQAARRLLRDWGAGVADDWRSWSLSRARARRAVAANDAVLRRLAGPERINGRWAGCPAAPPSGQSK